MGFIAKAVKSVFSVTKDVVSFPVDLIKGATSSAPKRQAPPVQPIQQAISPEPIVRKQATQAAKSGVIRRQGQTNEATGGGGAPSGLFTAGGTAGVSDEELNLQKTMLGG
jgi:hypothetical protein